MEAKIYNPEGFEVKFHQPCLDYELHKQKIKTCSYSINSEAGLIEMVSKSENHYLDANILGELCNQSDLVYTMPLEWKAYSVAFIGTLYIDHKGRGIIKVLGHSGNGTWYVYNTTIESLVKDEWSRERTRIAVV